MSQKLYNLRARDERKKLSRDQILALAEPLKYEDGMTKQCHASECDINKIMARFDRTGTISHVAKYEGVYADFSDFDFHEQTNKLTRGREIFDDLPAEIRQEFGQNPGKFFAWVNDPKNEDDVRAKLLGLGEPGRQLPSADQEAAIAAASEPVASETIKEPPATPES